MTHPTDIRYICRFQHLYPCDTQPNISYTNISYMNTNATLQLTISKRELYTKDSFSTFHWKRQSELFHLNNIINLLSNLSLKHEMLVEKPEVSSKIERRLTRLGSHEEENRLKPKLKSIIRHPFLRVHLKTEALEVSSVADFTDMVQASRLASYNQDSRYSIMTTGRFDRCTASYTKRVHRQTRF